MSALVRPPEIGLFEWQRLGVLEAGNGNVQVAVVVAV
jgi:hypothetical protein